MGIPERQRKIQQLWIFLVLSKGKLIADPPNRLGNEFYILQILDNLISNTIKFSPPGTTPITRTHFDKEYFNVDINNDGLTDEDLKKLVRDYADNSLRIKMKN